MLRGLKSVEPIRVLGLKDPELPVRLAATHALGQLGDGAGLVGVAMGDENVRVRLEAVRQLGGSLGDARGLHDFGLQVTCVMPATALWPTRSHRPVWRSLPIDDAPHRYSQSTVFANDADCPTVSLAGRTHRGACRIGRMDR